MSDSHHNSIKPKVRTCLWFNDDGEEVAEFYTSLLPNSFIESRSYPGPGKPALIVESTIPGATYMILNGGPHFSHTPAAAISALTKDQAETDALWDKLL